MADSYSLSGGLTEIFSTSLGREISVNPNPSGISLGTVSVEIDAQSGDISMGRGDYIELADFEASLSLLGTTRWNAVATGVSLNLAASGTLDANGRGMLESGVGTPAITVTRDFRDCTGLFCGAIMDASLDAVSYQLEVDFSDDYSSFTATLTGTTDNGSTLSLLLEGLRN